MTKNKNYDKVLKEWRKSGLEFEYEVEKVFEKLNWLFKGESNYQVYRELPEMGFFQKEFVERSVDLDMIKMDIINDEYVLYQNALVEVKYLEGCACFLRANTFLSALTRNLILPIGDPIEYKPFTEAQLNPLFKSPFLYKGKGIRFNKENNKQGRRMDIINKGINQLRWACINEFFHSVYAGLALPSKKLYGINLIHLVLATSGGIYVRNENMEKGKEFSSYFVPVPYGVILFPLSKNLITYAKKLISEWSIDEDKKKIMFDLLSRYLPGTRIYIVNNQYLEEFLSKLYTACVERLKQIISPLRTS